MRLLACLLCLYVICYFAAEVAGAEPQATLAVQCKKGLDGLYPLLDTGKFNKFVRCKNGEPLGDVKTCPKGKLFSFGWQLCVEERFIVAFDERPFAGVSVSSADGVAPAAIECEESVDPEDPSVYFRNCNGIKMKGQCDKGKTWRPVLGCEDTLGATTGNDYEGYIRLDNWDYKSNRVPCSVLGKVYSELDKNPKARFVMKLIGRTGVSADFAFEAISRSRGVGATTGFTNRALLRIMSETNIKELDVNGSIEPGFYIGYELRPPPTYPDGDITEVPGCFFNAAEPTMIRRVKQLGITPPEAAVTIASDVVIPAGVTPQCVATGVLTGVSCLGGAACAFFSFGTCAGIAAGICGGGVISTVQCVETSGGKCFPADALVQLPDGKSKRMDQLAIGDKVQTMSASGDIAYSDVYLFGHDDPYSFHEFVALKLSSRELQLSAGHFIPIASGPACSINNPAACSQLMKRAVDVQLGDLVWAMNATSGHFGLERVREKGFEDGWGLYNPFTLSGDLVVNGVLASAHSDWFLDRVMPQSCVSNIPAIYQGVMTPMRAVYYVGGANAVKYLDANLKVVEIASKINL